MKNLFFFNQRSNAAAQATECAYTTGQKFGVNPTKTSTFGRFATYIGLVLVMLVTLGVGEMKAWDCGWWDTGSGNVTFTINGTDKTPSTLDRNKSNTSDYDLGTVTTSLKVKSAWGKTWGQNNIASMTLYYRVKARDASSSASFSSANVGWNNNFDTNNQYWENSSINASLNIDLAPGNYEIEYYMQLTINDNHWCEYTALNNGGNNYHANFTIPSKNLTVAGAANGNTVSGSVEGITKGTAYAIEATPTDGYTFTGWSTSDSHITIANTSSASTTVTFNNYSANATVTASFTLETSHTVAVTYVCTETSANVKSAENPKVGEVTTSTFTAGTPTGYSFTSWTVGDGLTITSGSINTNSITIKTKASGTYTLRANYSEVLTSTYKLKGAFDSWGSGLSMSKKSGHSTEDWVYCTKEFTTSEVTAIKIHDGSSTWYGAENSSNSLVKKTSSLKTDDWTLTSTNGGNNIYFGHYISGTYEFAYNTSTKKFYVTWPDVNQLQIYSASPTDATNTNNFDLSAPSSNVRSKTLSLNANTTYTFKIVYGSDYYGKNSGALTRSTSTSSNTLTELSTSGGNITLTTDYAGDYTFKFNQSDKSISVDFPAAYKVTWGVGDLKGNSRTVTCKKYGTETAVVSNSTWIKSGDKVTFYAGSNDAANVVKAGYGWKGYYGASDGSGSQLSSQTGYSPAITSNTTIYACFYEVANWITIVNSGNGEVDPNGANAYVETERTFTADPDHGWKFYNWTIPANVTAKSGYSASSNPLIVNATAAATLTANFQPRWGLFGENLPGNSSWSDDNYQIEDNFYESPASSGKYEGQEGFTLAANTTYQLKVKDRKVGDMYGFASGAADVDIYYSESNTYSTLTNASGNGNVYLHSAAQGTYTFKWNEDTKKLAVDYPASWYITTGVNDADGGSFTAVDNSSNNVYGGKFVANSANVVFTATSNTGYNFSSWYSNSTCTTPYTAGTGVAFSGEGNTVMTLSGITADKTVYAKFTAKEYTVALDMQSSAEGYGSGSNGNETVTYNATLTTAGSLPTAANGYAFMGFYSGTGGKGTQFINASGTWATSVADTISDSKWVLDAGATLYAYYKKAEITELTLVDAIVAQNVTNGVKVTPTISPTPAGTTHIDWRVLYSNGNPLAEQPSMSTYNTTGKQFTSPATSGTYLVEAVLRTGSTANAGTTIDSTTASFQVAGEHTVTIQYKCGDDVIASSTSMTGKPLEWTEVVAHKIFGYTYSSMTAGDGVTLRDTTAARLTELQAEDPTIVAVKRMKAVYDGKLTINYTQNQMIYFKNTLGWSDVYVHFLPSSYWTSGKGSGNNGKSNCNKHMTRIGETDVWYYDYGSADITPSLYIAFTSASQSNVENFWAKPSVNVVYPANYQDDINTDKAAENGFKAAVPMFVPLAGQTATTLNSSDGGKANYYNRGYWTKYLPGTGYTLEIYNSAGSSLLKSIEFTSADELMPMKAVADLEAATTYKFQIRRGGTESNGIYYGNSGSMTSSNNGNGNPWELINTMTPSFTMVTIKTTASGDYTYNLSYSANASSQYRLRIAVDYPAATGDFQVLYSDTTTWSNGQHAAAWRHPSRVITARANGKDTISFFVAKNKKPAINAQKISTINASTGAITWTATNIGSNASQSLDAVEATGVYNFVVTQNAAGTAITSVENIGEYTGNYYIRTDAANNKWDSYRAIDHQITYSEYAKDYSDYTHYFMAHVGSGTNIKFVIANDFSACVSDTLIRQTYRGGDASHVDTDGEVQAEANVRFMYDLRYNRLTRAYLAAAKSDGSKFLVLRANTSSDMMDANGNALLNSANYGEAGYNHKAPDNSIQFVDNENWIYETDIKIQPGAFVKLYAYFNSSYFYYKGTNDNTFDASHAINLMTGEGDPQLIRVIYDFKTDRLVAAWTPSGEINGERAINADVMFVREHQGDIAQITFTESGKITEINTAYGVLRFNKWTLNNKSKADGHAPLSPALSRYERDLFYVSFPFTVAMNEVFGFGKYGQHWIIEEYDGAGRAANGFWADSPSYWRFVTDRKGKYFQPNQGYIIALDLDELGESADVWANDVENVELYFPSYGKMDNITSSSVVHTLPAHQCNIAARFEGGEDRRVKDSHWNVMSVPTYVNTSSITFANTEWTATRPKFLYEWNPDDNSLTARSGSGFTYHAMHAYMVQYAGNVTWTSSVNVSPSVVARQQDQPQEIEFRIELKQNEATADQTFVSLSSDEQVSAAFDFNYDLCKEMSKSKANIYTMITSMIDDEVALTKAAGNVLPMTEQTTVVPVGVTVAANDDYTFSIPEGTEGIGVTLIDKERGIRTSLSAVDYTVSLEEGTYNERFVLEISPIQHIATEIEPSAVSDQQSDVRKLLIDGLLYIVRDGKVYDARGARIE